MRRALLSLVLVVAVACTDDPNNGIDPFPVRVSLDAGPVLIGAISDPDILDAGTEAPQLVVDTLSPITVLDAFGITGALPTPRRRRVTLTLFGLDDNSAPTVPRVRFSNVSAFELHPCANGDVEVDCTVGFGGQTAEVAGILGFDVLGRSSVRFDFLDGTIRFFPDAAGSDADRGRACDAVFSSPYAGGGTLIIAGSEATYAARRPTVGACMNAPALSNIADEGVDALLLVSTALGMSVLSTSAYERYRRAVPDAPSIASLPEGVLHRTTGPQPVKIAVIDAVTLVGDESDERGPCRELYANKVMKAGGCDSDEAGPNAASDCPCSARSQNRFCRTAAATVLTKPIRFAILDDADPVLQSLRDELRPEFPEVDGILGVEPLMPLRVELDYPNSRILMRCLDPMVCQTRPKVRSEATRSELDGCDPPPPEPDAGPIQ